MTYEIDAEAINLKRNALWPTMLYVAEYPQWRREQAALVELCRRRKKSGESWGIAERAKFGLYESRPDLFSEPEAAGLMQFCGGLIAALLGKDVSFAESWCHITNGGGYHDAHAHLDFARHGICGIYYLQAADCSAAPPNGLNRFFSPSPFQPNDVVDLLPKDGHLVLFPGHIRHSATPYRGSDDRIVISFNARLQEPRS